MRVDVRGGSPAEHRFCAGMALAILVIVVGFSRSFFLRPLFPDGPSPPETIFYVHGAAFTAGIVLLLAQASLVRGGRTDVHRRVGPYGAMLAIVMVVLGVLSAHWSPRGARRASWAFPFRRCNSSPFRCST